jgi:folate-binding protein YgfZ
MDEWLTFLRQSGAAVEDGAVAHFGDPAAERRAAADADIIADLSNLALIEATGKDARSFLHAQLSNDIESLPAGRSTLAAYCNPKGRMFAVLRILRTDTRMFLQLPATQADTVLKRLRMFVLRAEVGLQRVDEQWVLMGLSGPRSEALLAKVAARVPVDADAVHEEDGLIALRLPGPRPRYELLVDPGRSHEVWSSLAMQATPAGPGSWAWLDIRAGLPSVVPATSEEFVPQMTNLDLLGGVSFTKGCYPGQEIVARMHYLGRLKQRMVVAHVEGAQCPEPGNKVYAASHGEQAAGTVVDAREGPEGGCDLLAVVQLACLGKDHFHLGDPEGPVLKIGELPYSIEAPARESE